MSKFIILATQNHPFYQQLQDIGETFFDLENDEPFDNHEKKFKKAEAIFDFTSLDKEKKDKLIAYLNVEYKIPLFSDLSQYWGELLCQKYPQLTGGFAGLFYSPQKRIEVFSKTDDGLDFMKELFSKLEHEVFPVETAGIGFTFPRIISMIINESYFALEDKLAHSDDIDTAMLFGVNYPLGPLEWKNKIGAKPIVTLLDELYFVTKDDRYKAAPLLRKEANF
jgi:3-hydroxybutyryl-CoA dehydrogenase